MSKEPPPTSDFPLPKDKVDEQIADVGRLADRDFERFGWNEPKPSLPPKRKRAPRKKKVQKQ
ncbi:hypothetical protein [Sphingomonas sp.]|uniref:hypothetical protein n=1 Tax=Sphingomonas sp. TaxID=28214 RepID=UPI003BACC024